MADKEISIHTPRMGGDLESGVEHLLEELISIHTPRMGGDNNLVNLDDEAEDFNPHPPHGG